MYEPVAKDFSESGVAKHRWLLAITGDVAPREQGFGLTFGVHAVTWGFASANRSITESEKGFTGT